MSGCVFRGMYESIYRVCNLLSVFLLLYFPCCVGSGALVVEFGVLGVG